jgi:hypothetical protein
MNGAIVERTKLNGFDLNQPLKTIDGDEAVVLTVNSGHPFPIVGEVHDHNADVCWLARWSTTGRYLGTHNAALAHSLTWNVPGFKGVGLYQTFGGGKRAGKSTAVAGNLSRPDAYQSGAPADPLGAIKLDIAAAKRATLNAGLSRIYGEALSENSHLTVAAIARHVERLIEEGRLSLPHGTDGIEFDDLTMVVRYLSTNPGRTTAMYK